MTTLTGQGILLIMLLFTASLVSANADLMRKPSTARRRMRKERGRRGLQTGLVRKHGDKQSKSVSSSEEAVETDKGGYWSGEYPEELYAKEKEDGVTETDEEEEESDNEGKGKGTDDFDYDDYIGKGKSEDDSDFDDYEGKEKDEVKDEDGYDDSEGKGEGEDENDYDESGGKDDGEGTDQGEGEDEEDETIVSGAQEETGVPTFQQVTVEPTTQQTTEEPAGTLLETGSPTVPTNSPTFGISTEAPTSEPVSAVTTPAPTFASLTDSPTERDLTNSPTDKSTTVENAQGGGSEAAAPSTSPVQDPSAADSPAPSESGYTETDEGGDMYDGEDYYQRRLVPFAVSVEGGEVTNDLGITSCLLTEMQKNITTLFNLEMENFTIVQFNDEDGDGYNRHDLYFTGFGELLGLPVYTQERFEEVQLSIIGDDAQFFQECIDKRFADSEQSYTATPLEHDQANRTGTGSPDPNAATGDPDALGTEDEEGELRTSLIIGLTVAAVVVALCGIIFASRVLRGGGEAASASSGGGK